MSLIVTNVEFLLNLQVVSIIIGKVNVFIHSMYERSGFALPLFYAFFEEFYLGIGFSFTDVIHSQFIFYAHKNQKFLTALFNFHENALIISFFT